MILAMYIVSGICGVFLALGIAQAIKSGRSQGEKSMSNDMGAVVCFVLAVLMAVVWCVLAAFHWWLP